MGPYLPLNIFLVLTSKSMNLKADTIILYRMIDECSISKEHHQHLDGMIDILLKSELEKGE